jgi:hypothetical protein
MTTKALNYVVYVLTKDHEKLPFASKEREFHGHIPDKGDTVVFRNTISGQDRAAVGKVAAVRWRADFSALEVVIRVGGDDAAVSKLLPQEGSGAWTFLRDGQAAHTADAAADQSGLTE